MDTKQKQDTPMTLATIEAFRGILDVMEEFVRNTEQEALESDKSPSSVKKNDLEGNC